MKKRCSKCNQWKDNSEFYHDRAQKDGLKSYCIACEKAYKEEVKAKNNQEKLKIMREIHHGELLDIDTPES